MTTDALYRIVFAALIVSVSATQYVYRRAHKRKYGTRHVDVAVEDRTVYVIPFWVASISLYPFGFWWFEVSAPLPHWLRWIGVLGLIASIPCSVWVFRALGANFSANLELHDDHELVRHGPYKYVRHPMYTTLILCVIAASLLSANLFVALTSGFIVVAMIVRLRKEETMLQERFNGRYHTYMETTGALVPRLR